MAESSIRDDYTVQTIIPENCPISEQLQSTIEEVFVKQLGIKYDITSNDDHPSVHTFVICLDSSRLDADVKKAVKGLSIQHPKNYCIIYLRRFEVHALSRATINSHEVFKAYEHLSRFGSIIDCVYNKTNDIYNCDVNTKAVQLIFQFLNRVRLHYNVNVPENIKKEVTQLFGTKLGLLYEIIPEDDISDDSSVKPVFVIYPAIKENHCIIGLRKKDNKLEVITQSSSERNEILDLSEEVLQIEDFDEIDSHNFEKHECDFNENGEQHFRQLLKRVKVHYNQACRTQLLAHKDNCICNTVVMGGRQSTVSGERPLPKPWRHLPVSYSTKGLTTLKNKIRDIKPQSSGCRMNIAILGKLQAGKSSFINTVLSAFADHVKDNAYAAPKAVGVTNKFRKYKVSDGTCDHFRLCDTRGIEMELGISSPDFNNLIEGHIKEGYTFGADIKINKQSQYFEKSPTFSDRMHCVCFVFDANKFNAQTEEEFESVRDFLTTIADDYDLRCVVLLTHLDEVSEMVEDDASTMYRSKTVKECVEDTASKLEINTQNIVPVVNYVSQNETSEPINILALTALLEMLRKCEELYEQNHDVPSLT